MRDEGREQSLTHLDGSELTDRERRVLEAVVRIYVDTAEPAGSRNVVRTFDLGVSPATVRNTMSDLEEKGYLLHPHASAGRVPTDRAYRLFVDQLIHAEEPAPETRHRLALELDPAGSSAVETLIRRTSRVLSVLCQELGVAVAPALDGAVLDRLDLIRVSASKVLLVLGIRTGVVRTVYVDLSMELPEDALVDLTRVLNERLAGLTLAEIRRSLPERIRDAPRPDIDPATEELINIFMQSGAELFDWPDVEASAIHLGNASVLATQPEFTSGERLKDLIELTERRDLLASVLGDRAGSDELTITIGNEHESEELAEFTLITAGYRVGDLKGVIGVIGPTRMPYEKVIAVVDHTSSLINNILR